ncbi:MAG TPA: PIG-L family deacetylase [Gemmatimonadaceae bacterium]
MRVAIAVALVIASTFSSRAGSQTSRPLTDQKPQALLKPGEAARVLYIAAHPDDEDTQLITWLAKSGRAEVAYLSLNRGDGGQNLIGNELGEALGIVRTEELLAARRVDGAHQYFTRAYDFGFSKSADETYTHWPKDSLLTDMVKIVRAFRPHIIVTTFSGTPSDGHGQHQVSALLAHEAWDAAANTERFPVATFGAAWKPLKMYRFGRFSTGTPALKINVGEYNPLLGKSYSEIAAESRSQHKSQGFGTLQRKGVVLDSIRLVESRVGPVGVPEKSMFDGIPGAGIPGAVRSAEQLLRDAGVAVEAIADRRAVALGDSALVRVVVYNRGRTSVSLASGGSTNGHGAAVIAPDSALQWTTVMRGATITQPWWLVRPRTTDLFAVPIDGLSEEDREMRNWVTVSVDLGAKGGVVEARVPAVYRYADPVRGDVQRPVAVVPLVSVALSNPVELARANYPLDRYFNVTLRSASMRPMPVKVSLVLPAGLTADSATKAVSVDSAGTRTVTFHVRGRLPAGNHVVEAKAEANGVTFATGYVPIDYEHISPERLYRPATVRISAIDVALDRNLTVAYIPGAADNVALSLKQLGIPVTVVEPSEIPTVDLSLFHTVVIGPRAYEAHRELVDNNPYLLDYARRGGTLVVQYGQYEMTRPGVMPYPITISRPHDRVTDENAPVIVDRSADFLVHPNRIGDADFQGWVQERSLYMPRTFDERYQSFITMNDPGEPPNRGAILVTPYGNGLYVYTTLAFFRQLPAGVAGGTRLFANLLSMTRKGTVTSTR